MNELTKQLQEIMVPKAALIAYEYPVSYTHLTLPTKA